MRIEKKKEDREREDLSLTTERKSEARGGDVPEANPKSEECMIEEVNHNTEGEGALESERMSGSLNRTEVSRSELKSGRQEIRKNQ